MALGPMPAMQALSEIRQQFSQGKPASLLVTGTSMVPFLRHEKDWVILAPAEGEPRVGQILLFRMGDRLVLHRLRKKRQGSYVMNGDGLQKIEIIEPRQVEAVVTAIVRRSGRTISCEGLLFLVLTALWWPTRPLRPMILRIAAGLKDSVRGRKGGGTL